MAKQNDTPVRAALINQGFSDKTKPDGSYSKRFGFLEMDIVKTALLKACHNFQKRGDGEMAIKLYTNLNNIMTANSVLELYAVPTIIKLVDQISRDAGMFSAALEINYVFQTIIADEVWIDAIIKVLASTHPAYTLNENINNYSIVLKDHQERLSTPKEFEDYLRANIWLVPLLLLRTL